MGGITDTKTDSYTFLSLFVCAPQKKLPGRCRTQLVNNLSIMFVCFVLFYAGGYTAGPKSIIDLLKQESRPYIFSNTLSPPLVAIANKVSVISVTLIRFWSSLRVNLGSLRSS